MPTAPIRTGEPGFFSSVPSPIPATWEKDVSKLDAVLTALGSRHQPFELAQLIVIAANRTLTGTKRRRNGLAAAMVRGVRARESLKEAEGGSVSAEGARTFLGDITKQAVLDRYKKGRLLGWRESRQNAVRFPIWQFTPEGVMPGLEEILGILRASPAVDDWGAILFFHNKRPSLDNTRPLDALRKGDLAAVKRAAHGFVAG